MKLIDFHTHILPRVDDGASSKDISFSMLQSLEEQGIGAVLLTPHYYSNHEPISKFAERRDKARFTSLESEGLPQLLYGAEVRLSEYLFNNRDLSPLCVEGTRTMLLELPFDKRVGTDTIRMVERLIGEYGITPVLAHVERYAGLMKSTRTMEELIDIGCVLQVNLSSFTAFGKRRLVSLMNNGYIGAVGTDSHNLTTRPPDYMSGYERLCRSCSAYTLECLQKTMANLLKITDC